MTAEDRPVAATADHLTLALRRSGVLGQGRVSNVVVEREIKKTRSHTLRLRLSYDGDRGAAPSWLILKTGRRFDGGQTRTSAGRREVAFYREVASGMSARTVPRCFEALWDETGEWSLLLEDLTDTHVIATEWPLPPTTEQCGSIVQVLARFHAAWWDDPRLGRSIGQVCGANDLRRWQQDLTRLWERFKARYADLLTPARGDLLSQVIDRAPDRLARLQGRNLTIVHGDAHVWNAFVRRNGDDAALLLDWEDWSLGIATDDLAYMMAMHWYPDRRRRMEKALLDCYHATLLAQGVSGYDRPTLDEDYRWSVLWQITRPIWQEAFNVPARVWWNNLERAFLAIDDLDCRDLLA